MAAVGVISIVYFLILAGFVSLVAGIIARYRENDLGRTLIIGGLLLIIAGLGLLGVFLTSF